MAWRVTGTPHAQVARLSVVNAITFVLKLSDRNTTNGAGEFIAATAAMFL